MSRSPKKPLKKGKKKIVLDDKSRVSETPKVLSLPQIEGGRKKYIPVTPAQLPELSY